MTTLATIFIGAVGLVIGSFLNVIIYRFPRGESIVYPASHCPNCKEPIAWYDNIPVLSWYHLDGKCRSCNFEIPIRYPLVELLTGGLTLAVWLKSYAALHLGVGVPIFSYELLIVFSLYAIFIYLLIVLSFIDLDHTVVPHSLTVPGIVLGLFAVFLFNTTLPPGALQYFWPPVTFFESAVGVFVGGFSVVAIFYVYLAVQGEVGIGGGDATLMALAGAWLGWPAIIFIFFAGSLQGLIGAGIAQALDSDLLMPSSTLQEEPSNESGSLYGPNAKNSGESESVADDSDTAPASQKEAGDKMAIPFGPFIALAMLEHFFLGSVFPQVLSMKYLYFYGM